MLINMTRDEKKQYKKGRALAVSEIVAAKQSGKTSSPRTVRGNEHFEAGYYSASWEQR